MIVPEDAKNRMREGERSTQGRSSQEEPEFHNHDVAIALQRRMTGGKVASVVLQRGKSTLSHW